MTDISTNCASLFHLLVHAALFPRLGLEVPSYASSLEEDEASDALAHGGITWDYLLYVWAFETGEANLESIVGGQPVSIDATGFYEALGELQEIADLEFSVPLHPMGLRGPVAWAESPFEEMPQFEGQRLHLCKRSIWFEIDFTSGDNYSDLVDEDEIEASTVSGEVPVFAEPVHSSDSSGRLGQVWVRVTEDSRAQLQLALSDTLESLAILGDARAEMLQEALHQEQPDLDSEQLKGLNSYVLMLREHAGVHRDTARRIAEIEDSKERERVVATSLELINSEHREPGPGGEHLGRPSVFLSYSHDSDLHRAWVLALSEELAASGIDARLDAAQESPEEGWPRWMHRQVEATDFVLCICTPQYKERFESKQALGTGRGADWEGLLITQQLYESGSQNRRVIPVLPDFGSGDDIPLPLRAFTYYKLPTDQDRLLRRLAAPPEE